MTSPITRIHDFDLDHRADATVVSSERITPESSDVEVREIAFDVDRPGFRVDVGQSLAVIAPGTPEIGNDVHVRFYSVADLPERGPNGDVRVRICVRRVSYVDEYSGERYKGVASNYLCNLNPGDTITIAGPFGIPYPMPTEPDSTLLLIGTGTGIAPFRAFVKKLYAEKSAFTGKVYLFYGAPSGIEMLYMNEEKNDFAKYYDDETFQAFKALSARPSWADPIGWDFAFKERGDEILTLLDDPKTCVYVAGLEKMRAELDKIFVGLVGSDEAWEEKKSDLIGKKRWVELLY